MTAYVLQRLAQGVFALAAMTVIVFTLGRATGDPLDFLVPLEATPEFRAELEQRLGLDRPLIEQFGTYVSNLVQGDLGISLHQRVPVTELFADRFPNSLRLIIPAFVVSSIIGIPLGVISATTRIRPLAWLLGGFSGFGIAVPLFWLALVFILLFSVGLNVLPSSRMGGLQHYVLPVATLATFLVAGLMRLVRTSMLEVLGTDYVKLARLEGLSERSVIWRYALRNSLTSTIAFIGVYFAAFITGSIVLETVFAWPGAGQLLYQAILTRDYPVVQGVVIITTALIVIVGLVADILNAYLDPRIRL